MSNNEKTEQKIKNPKGRRWPFRIKAQAVEEVDSGHLTLEEAKAKYGFSSNDTLAWWRRTVERGKPNTRKRVPLSIRIQTAEDVRLGIKTIEEAMEELGIMRPHTIRNWIKKFCLPDSRMDKSLKSPTNRDKSPPDPDPEIKRLQAELRASQLENLGLRTMIEVAEEEFGIKIRKKSGTKQSNE